MNLPAELRVIKIIAIDTVYDIVRWPVWWYTRGFWEVLKWAGRGMAREWWNLALGPWLRATFIPMYGDYSAAGRAISFVMRIVILAYRLAVFCFWLAVYFMLIIPYVAFPLLAVYCLLRFYGVFAE